MINSLLDTDLYKLTMMQAVLHQFPGTEVEYSFKCRNKPLIPLGNFSSEIEEEIRNLCNLTFTKEELDYLSTIRFFKKDFLEFLKYFKLDFKNVYIDKNDGFKLSVKGSWLSTILFEVPILAIINEVYSRKIKGDNYLQITNLNNKIEFVKNNNFYFSEFGTRRRYSKEWQEFVVRKLKTEIPEFLLGTSNVMLAKLFDLKPIGTMAHEFLQAAQQTGPRLIDSQKFALQSWCNEYRGDLGIALTDVIGIDAFLEDFDLYFAKLFDGVRHDSGNPISFGEKIIKHYEKLKIDPKTKCIVFSDGLDFRKAYEINKVFINRIKVSFGIGTDLTNDCGREPLQIVMKMIRCNGQPVAKLSDNTNKIMCEDEGYINYLKQVFKKE